MWTCPRYGRAFTNRNQFRIRTPEELDDEVVDWLREAYAVGLQEHLVHRRPVHSGLVRRT